MFKNEAQYIKSTEVFFPFIAIYKSHCFLCVLEGDFHLLRLSLCFDHPGRIFKY